MFLLQSLDRSSSVTAQGTLAFALPNLGFQGVVRASSSTPSLQQTVCPQCNRRLLVPAGTSLFRCPCGVLFRYVIRVLVSKRDGHVKQLQALRIRQISLR